MGTYLFSWNPTKWPWDTYEQCVVEIEEGAIVTKNMRCINYKNIKPGDRAFLTKVGAPPRGIIGSGTITILPFESPHKYAANKIVHLVTIKFDVLLDAYKEPIITNEILKLGNLAAQNWSPQSSGISIRPALVYELEAVWEDFLRNR